ncbi:MAG TPA: nitrous oxide reductase accessory protein NosL [bacterium]|nr:nitrous oxide reductase accessory protein NosL [bacterium]
MNRRNALAPARRGADWLALGLAALLALALLGGCHRKQSPIAQAFAAPLTHADSCAVDGMVLMEHPGPKGQILLPDGTRRYYCDLKEMFGEWFDGDRTPEGAMAFVQAMDGRDWSAHPDGWVRAEDARYVLGSPLAGSMGPTMVPFREQAAADAFIASHGGHTVAYAALNADAVAAYDREVRDMMRHNKVVFADGQAGGKPMPGMAGMSQPVSGMGGGPTMQGMNASK